MEVEDLLVSYVYSEESGIVTFEIQNTTTIRKLSWKGQRTALEDRLKLTVPCGTHFLWEFVFADVACM